MGRAGTARVQEAGTARVQQLKGSGFRHYLGVWISPLGQFLNPEPCLLNPAS